MSIFESLRKPNRRRAECKVKASGGIMEFKFSIDMKTARLRNISTFLGGLTLVRDGIELMISGEREQMYARIEREIEKTFNLSELLMDLGRRLAERDEWSVPSQPIFDIVFQSLLRVRGREEDIRLVALTRGSL